MQSRDQPRGELCVPSPYRVVDRTVETADTVTLAIAPVDSLARAWEPGQFNMLWMPAVGEVPISISGGVGGGATGGDRGGDGTVLLHTIRAVGAVTRALCALEPGQTLGVRGPYGRGWDLDAASGRDVVIVGGGLGLAPLRPVVHETLRGRDRYGRLAFLAGARTPEDLLYMSELGQWRARTDLQTEVTVDAVPGREWRGDVGVVTTLLPRIPFDPGRVVALVCGPEVMMRFVAAELLRQGVAPGDIQVSLERTMQCAVGSCGHCQLGSSFICRDGPVVTWERVGAAMGVRER